jgi:hypothetical protein
MACVEGPWEVFCQDVGGLVGSTNIGDGDGTIFDAFADDMVLDVDVLRSTMVRRVLPEDDGALVVATEQGGGGRGLAELL